ncbi:MAG: dihydrodipicolinate synthase family protein [Clostridia bacterium]|nr:dihydrodipicolinate synthase family protein [Clostridia bacterium]
MKRRTELGGVIPATVTSFREDESIDEAAMLRLMDWNLSQGVEAF